MNYKYLGVIELGDRGVVRSPVTRVVFSDPCYTSLDSFNYVLNNVKSGIYKVYITYDLHDVNRISKLVGVYVDLDVNSLTFEDNHMSMCVDSGQCGFYDYDYFMHIIKDDISGMSPYHEEWYDKVCAMTYYEEDNDGYLSYIKFKEVYNTYDKLKKLYYDLVPAFEHLEFKMNLLDTIKLSIDMYDLELMKGTASDKRTLDNLLVILQSSLSSAHNAVYTMFNYNYSGGLTGGRGAVSSAGIGDGLYPILCHKESDGLITGFEIVYMFDEPFNSDWDDDEDDY